MSSEPIYHIVTEADFRSCSDGQRYLPSGFGATGFVHCALEASVLAVANDYYSAVSEPLLLLRIDPDRLTSETKYEAASPSPDAGASHLATSPVFPHVYGPIDLAAIDGAGLLTKGRHGWEWPTAFVSPEAPPRSIGVSEQLPEAGQRVLFVVECEGGSRVCLGYRSSGGTWVAESEYDRDGNYLRTETTTHWMPLPELAGPPWTSVLDGLPEPRRVVLFAATFEGGPGVCLGFWTGDGARWKDQTDYDRTGEYRDVYSTTHWLPLPELTR